VDSTGWSRHEVPRAGSEAVRLYRSLATHDPGTWNPQLAEALLSLALGHSENGHWNQALDASTDAMDIYRDLAADDPGTWNPHFANALLSLAFYFARTGRPVQSDEAGTEAVRLYRDLATEDPGTWKPHLANALQSLARSPKFLDAHIEAVRLYRDLDTEDPGTWKPHLANALNRLADVLSFAGRLDQALEARTEAVRLYRDLATEDPGAWKPHLAGVLLGIAEALSKAGRPDEALEARAEAVRLYRDLATDYPGDWEPDLAEALLDLAEAFTKTGRRNQSLRRASLTARDINPNLATALISHFRGADRYTQNPRLTEALLNLARDVSIIGHGDQALDARSEAVRLYRDLATVDSRIWNPSLARALRSLADDLFGSSLIPSGAEFLFEFPSGNVEVVTKASPAPDTSPEPSAVRVYPRIDGPDVVVVGERFDLSIGVAHRRDRTLLFAGALSLPASGPVKLDLLVTYDPWSLRLEGDVPTTLQIDPTNPVATVPVRFTVLDGDDLASERRVGVHYLRNGVLIGIAWKRLIAVSTEVERDRTALPTTRENTLLNLAPMLQERPPDLILAVYRADDATAGHFIWAGYPTTTSITVPDLERSRRIGDEAKQFAINWRRTVAADRDPGALFDELVGRGLGIGRAIPFAMQRILNDLITDSQRTVPASVLLLTEEVHVPWELAAFRKPYALKSRAGGDSPFLGAHLAISRWPLTDDKPRPVLHSSLAVRRTAVISAKYEGVPRWERLAHAEQEAADLIAAHPPADEITPLYDDVMGCINGNPEAQVLHFALHGQFDPDGTSEGLVLLRPGREGTALPEFVSSYQIESANLPGSFIFLNACQVGAAKEVLGDYAGFAVAFLRAGASGVIAPLWNIDDAVAGTVARDFYSAVYGKDARSVGGGVSVAEALRRIRARYTKEAIREGKIMGHPTHIAYQFFGHPRLMLTHVPSSASATVSGRSSDG
jgi:tetratricopeptide (TPR) repeat protein